MSGQPLGSGLGDSFEFASVASPTTFTTLAGVESISFSGDKVTVDESVHDGYHDGVDTEALGHARPRIGRCEGVSGSPETPRRPRWKRSARLASEYRARFCTVRPTRARSLELSRVSLLRSRSTSLRRST